MFRWHRKKVAGLRNVLDMIEFVSKSLLFGLPLFLHFPPKKIAEGEAIIAMHSVLNGVKGF